MNIPEDEWPGAGLHDKTSLVWCEAGHKLVYGECNKYNQRWRYAGLAEVTKENNRMMIRVGNTRIAWLDNSFDGWHVNPEIEWIVNVTYESGYAR